MNVGFPRKTKQIRSGFTFGRFGQKTLGIVAEKIEDFASSMFAGNEDGLEVVPAVQAMIARGERMPDSRRPPGQRQGAADHKMATAIGPPNMKLFFFSLL